MKKCTKCGQLKEDSEFAKHKRSPDGLAGYCRKCQQKYNKDYYRKPDKRKKILHTTKNYYRLHQKEILNRAEEKREDKTSGEVDIFENDDVLEKRKKRIAENRDFLNEVCK